MIVSRNFCEVTCHCVFYNLRQRFLRLCRETGFDVLFTENLKHNTDFVEDNSDLLRERIKDAEWQLDPALVSLLLSDETIKTVTPEIKGVLHNESEGLLQCC